MLSDGNYAELIKFREGPIDVSSYENSRIQFLEDSGFIECTAHESHDRSIPGLAYIEITSKTYAITPLGEDALLEFEEVRGKEAEDKARQSRQEKIAIAQAVVPAITFILGLLVEHFSGVVEMAFSIFG